jgi:hypothetical protein
MRPRLTTKEQRRLRRALSLVAAVVWIGPIVAQWCAPADRTVFPGAAPWFGGAFVGGTVASYLTAAWFRPPFPFSVTSTMLVAVIATLAVIVAHPEPWQGTVIAPVEVPLRWIAPLALLAVYAWGVGAWGAELVQTDTMDSPSVD